MKKISITFALLVALTLAYISSQSQAESEQKASAPVNSDNKTAVFAGGCFWCIESDFEKLDGVSSVVSGYTGGDESTADYKTVSYTETGHFEAVEVSYDPTQVSYSELVEYFWRHIDPTEKIVEASLKALNESKPFDGDIVTTIAAAKPFYVGEEYHQDYYKKNPVRYRVYRTGCGRDRRIKQLWGE